MEIIIRLILGFAGVLIHCLKNFDSLKKDAKAIKVQFDFRNYLNADWLSISISLIAVLVWPFLFDEAATRYAYLEGWVRISFFCVGMLGSYGLQAILGKGRSTIRAMANEKAETLENIIKYSDAPGDGAVQPGKAP